MGTIQANWSLGDLNQILDKKVKPVPRRSEIVNKRMTRAANTGSWTVFCRSTWKPIKSLGQEFNPSDARETEYSGLFGQCHDC